MAIDCSGVAGESAEAVTAVTCNESGMFVFLPEGTSNYMFTKCKSGTLLEEKKEGLETHLFTLHFIREDEELMDTGHMRHFFFYY